MQAKDLMTTDVVVVQPHTPAADVARQLLEHTISAAPVVDSTGAPVGMVSEGDLIGRNEDERDARRDWWLAVLAGSDTVTPDVLKSAAPREKVAQDIMAAPVITVTEDTDATEIARVLAAYRIKRVPVVREGRIVGIVSRADLLRALAAEHAPEAPAKPHNLIAETLEKIDRHFREGRDGAAGEDAKPATALGEENLNASDFRSLVMNFELDKSHRVEAAHEAAATQLKAKVKDLIDHHIADENWQALVHRAREAAMRGEKKYLLLRFPSQLCSDRGRAINVCESDWPATLRGEAAEIYLRWEHDLRPQGFHLTAEILNFPGGMPGEIGLFLVWGP
jgi:CBS domain-containing protein